MRLPDLDPGELTADQRRGYDTATEVARSSAYAGYAIQRPDGGFVGPWSVMVHFPDLVPGWAALTGAVGAMDGLSAAARQVVILTVGGRFGTAYALTAHARVAAGTGLRPDQIATLSAGRRPADLTRDQALASDVTTALLRGGVLPAPLYEVVVAKLGRTALDTIVFVTIYYTAVCTMLNAYDVPPGTSAGVT